MAKWIDIGSFVFEVQRSQVGNRQTNEQMDRRTKGHVENIMCIECIPYGKIQYLFAINISFMCLNHAQRVLSAIVKLFVQLLGKRRGGVYEKGER